jgi:transposase InsO family protein
MTIIDTSTRLIEIHAMRDGTSAEAAAIIDRYWFNKYPRPRRCVYDQGSEFKLEFLELLDSYGVGHAPTTTRNPQANAVIERVHRVIGDKMRTRELKDGEDWDAFLHNVTFALRAAYHTMTGASPAQLAFGRDMLVDLRHETDWGIQKEKKLQQIRAHAQRENHDRREWNYNPGDQIFLKNDVKVRGKLLPVQSGPYEVVSVRDNGTLTDKGKYVETVSIRRIAPCRD